MSLCKVNYSYCKTTFPIMNLDNHNARQEDEYSRLMKILNFRLPHRFKKIGLITSIIIFSFLIGYKFYGSNDLLIKDVCRHFVLLFLLMASLSKDAVEDEYLNHVRYQSYVLAFICAVGYSVGIPLIAFLMDILIANITSEEINKFYEVSAFEVIFILVCLQLLFFETLKRFGRAQ